MKNKEEILQIIRNIIHENNLKIYTLAKITGINRSTLQKSLEGTRNLKIRQFKELLKVLPISQHEKKALYSNYIECMWTKKQLIDNYCILDILNNISTMLNSNKLSALNMKPIGISDFKDIYKGQEAIHILNEITLQTLNNAEKNHPLNLYIFLPLYNDFFNSCISRYINNYDGKVKVSILFEFVTPTKYNSEKNLLTFKNILPLALNTEKEYQLNYIYIDDFYYKNHITIYPYYIIFPNIAVLLDAELTTITLIQNQNVIDFMSTKHKNKLQASNTFKTNNIDLYDCIQYLANNQIIENDIYSISYEPCISSFVTPKMYEDLITDDFPDKSKFIDIINTRITNMKNAPKKYSLFNKNSIIEFAETGNLIAYNHPCLKRCTLEQRKDILTNILNSMDDKKLIMRAFSDEEINVSKKYELTNIQEQYNINFFVYPDNTAGTTDTVRLINIYEPTISTSFINFIHDIIDTQKTFTYEETKDFIQEIINSLDEQIKTFLN